MTFGPTLKLWESDADSWTVSVLFAQEQASAPEISFKIPGQGAQHSANMEPLDERKGLHYFRYKIHLPLQDAPQVVSYKIGTKRASFIVPAKDTMPAVAYGSCNGFHSQKLLDSFLQNDAQSGELKATAMWRNMLQTHQQKPFHLLVLGGDQIYSDILLQRFESDVLDWSWYTRQSTRKKRKLSAKEQAHLRDLYTEMYTGSWGHNPEMKAMLASCPSLMMWDDHDIMDGWGSFENQREQWPAYAKGIFPEARRAFLLYQHHCKPTEKPGGSFASRNNFSTAHTFGGLGIVHLDTRSERTPRQIMSDDSWGKLKQWMETAPELKHLFFCVSVPVAYADFEKIEKILLAIPGDQGLEDDLRDHWRSLPHQITRNRLLEDLFAFSRKNQCRVTFVSGDVHVAAHGVIELSDGQHDNQLLNRMHQLISSPIMNKPGNFVVERLVGSQGEAREQISSTIAARMLPLAVAKGSRAKRTYYVWERNWLSLTPRSDASYRAEWFFENCDYPTRETIHAVS